MVSDAWFSARQVGLDGNDVETQRKRRNRRPIRERDAVEQRVRRTAQVPSLAVVDRLLSQPEVAAASPADLHDHEHRRRTRVDRHEVELVATDMDVPGQDGPAQVAQPRTDEGLGGVTRELRRRSRPGGGSAVHESMVSADAHPALSWRSPDGQLGLAWRLRGRELE